jgi:hypothetical protein
VRVVKFSSTNTCLTSFDPVAMAIITVVQSGLPGADLFQGNPVNFGVPWISLTVSLNGILTAMITIRLLMAHNTLQSVMGPEHSKQYIGIIAILVESAAPFTILGIVFAVLYSKSIPEEVFFSSVWGIFCVSLLSGVMFSVYSAC